MTFPLNEQVFIERWLSGLEDGRKGCDITNEADEELYRCNRKNEEVVA